MGTKEYRSKARVTAEKLTETGQVMTSNGPGFAFAGDYLVHGAMGTRIIPGEDFEHGWDEVKGDNEFHPAGKTVEIVTAFLDEHPDEVDRIKQEERDGASRKGILDYAK